MTRGRAGSRRVAVAAVSLGLLAGGCAKSTKTPDSTRDCAVVQADELSSMVGMRLKLLPAGELQQTCRFRGVGNPTEVDLALTAPVEAGTLGLLLHTPQRERDLGDEAWSSTTDTPLGFRLVARKKGAMVTIDVGIDGASDARTRKAARRIARAALPNLPKVAVAQPTGPRGEAACARFESTEAAEALGAEPEVSAALPPGSCLLSVPDEGLNVTVSVLATQANEETLGTITKGAPDPVLTSAAGMPAYWIAVPGAPASGGQLDFLDDDVLRQVSVIGSGFSGTEAQDLAIEIARIGFDEG